MEARAPPPPKEGGNGYRIDESMALRMEEYEEDGVVHNNNK